jgi:hypothetical protein
VSSGPRERAGVSCVPGLREALLDAATRRAAAGARPAASASGGIATARARRTIRHARRLPALAIALAAVLLTAAVALAASGLIRTGAPVKPPPGEHFTATTGFGVPIPATVRLLAISVPDPAGGLPWGMRYLQTTRGLGCVQIGRVLDGRLGILGRDGSFGDDGRFHELPPDIFDPLSCTSLDARGHAFLGVALGGFRSLPASGASGFLQECLPARAHGAAAARQSCPAGEERQVSYGLLGPAARTLSYRADGATRRVSLAGPQGAYLIVLPSTAPRGLAPGAPGASGGAGASRLTEVAYANGAICRIPPANRPGGARGCPLVGLVAPPATALSSVELAAPVTARLDLLRRVASRSGRQLSPPTGRLHVSFVARVAVSNADSRYVVELRAPASGACATGDHFVRLYPVERDVAVGELVHLALTLQPVCPGGKLSGRVLYVQGTPDGDPLPLSMLRGTLQALQQRGGRHAPLVGGFSLVVH